MSDQDQAGRIVGHFSAKIAKPEAKQTTPSSASNKAILFVPEGVDVADKNLEVEVVAIDAATFEAMGPRRC